MAVSSMNVSAVAPEGYDVNNDGRVNIADAVAISMALSGNSKASDNTALDVSRSFGLYVNYGVRSNGWRCYNYNAVKGG